MLAFHSLAHLLKHTLLLIKNISVSLAKLRVRPIEIENETNPTASLKQLNLSHISPNTRSYLQELLPIIDIGFRKDFQHAISGFMNFNN